MRLMMMVKADKYSEAGAVGSKEQMAAMGEVRGDITKAGVLLATEGLQPSSKGVRVKFSGGKRTVTDGPFTETKDPIASFAPVQVKSMGETIGWASRFARIMVEMEIEIRPRYEASDFAPQQALQGRAAQLATP